MPIFETVAYSLVITLFTCREIASLVVRTDYWIRYMTRNSLDNVPEDFIHNEVNEHIVLNDSVRRITYVLRNIKYGLLILSAPAGSGLMKALQKMTPQRHMKIFKGAYLLDFNKI
jgi:hypothetical protein